MSPTFSQEQQPKTVAELQLRPDVRAQLEAMISTWQELKFQEKLIAEQAGVEQSKIGKILADHGYDRVKIDDVNLEWHRGERTPKKLDVMTLLAQGVTQAQIEAATLDKPKKDYFKMYERTSKSENTDRDEE